MFDNNIQPGASGADLRVDDAVSTGTAPSDTVSTAPSTDAGKTDLPKLPLNSEHETDLFYAFEAHGGVETRPYASVPPGVEGVELLRQEGFDAEQVQMGGGLIVPIYDVEGKLSHHVVRFDAPRCDADGDSMEYERPPGAPVGVDVSPGQVARLQQVATPLIWTADPQYADSAALFGMVGLNIRDILRSYQNWGDSLVFWEADQKAQFIADLGLDAIAQVAWVEGRKVSRLNYVFLEENWVAGEAEGRCPQRTPVLHALCRAIEKRGGTVLLLDPPTEYDGIPIKDKSCLFFEFFGHHRPLDDLFAAEPYSDKSNRRRLQAAWRLVK